MKSTRNKFIITAISKRDDYFNYIINNNYLAVKLYSNYLLSLGESLNFTDCNGNTPLNFAVLHTKLEIVEYLIHCRVDLNKACNKGISPVHNAVKIFKNTIGGNPTHREKIVQALVKAGAYI